MQPSTPSPPNLDELSKQIFKAVEGSSDAKSFLTTLETLDQGTLVELTKTPSQDASLERQMAFILLAPSAEKIREFFGNNWLIAESFQTQLQGEPTYRSKLLLKGSVLRSLRGAFLGNGLPENFPVIDRGGANNFFLNLRGADLRGVDLSGTNLSHADLSRAILPTPDALRNINLEGAVADYGEIRQKLELSHAEAQRTEYRLQVFGIVSIAVAIFSLFLLAGGIVGLVLAAPAAVPFFLVASALAIATGFIGVIIGPMLGSICLMSKSDIHNAVKGLEKTLSGIKAANTPTEPASITGPISTLTGTPAEAAIGVKSSAPAPSEAAPSGPSPPYSSVVSETGEIREEYKTNQEPKGSNPS